MGRGFARRTSRPKRRTNWGPILTKTSFSLAALAAALLGGVSAASAADLPARTAPAVVPSFEAWSPWMIRGRALVVLPETGASLQAGGAPITGAGVDISTSVVPELDITYFFTPNIAAELILGVTPHSVRGEGALAGTPIGHVWLLPPTLTLQYHFTQVGAFKPYIGAGVNYTVFFEESARGPFTKFDLKNNVGAVLQAGVDIMIDRHWGINFDVKKVFLDTDVALNSGAVTGKVKIDPWLIGTGVTYRF